MRYFGWLFIVVLLQRSLDSEIEFGVVLVFGRNELYFPICTLCEVKRRARKLVESLGRALIANVSAAFGLY